jgi:pimeloyl-ACP methyl ester carboxylesterase
VDAGPVLVLCLFFTSQCIWAEAALFAKPGKMIDVGRGSSLSLYCVGTGSPTIILESGFGGGTVSTWVQLQPLLGAVTRTCSYDRAGYGFSSLGHNLPRDLNGVVADLARLLRRSGERPPYLLAGHSYGGTIIGAYADLYPKRVAGLLFLDAAVVLPEDVSLKETSEFSPDALQARLAPIRRCLERVRVGLAPAVGDACADPSWYASLPADVASAEVKNLLKPDYWRAYLSEAENNYSSRSSAQARALLPHKWGGLPVRVFVAQISRTLEAADARENRAKGEQRQRSLCAFAKDCRVTDVPTANHLVHNEALAEVVDSFKELLVKAQKRGP